MQLTQLNHQCLLHLFSFLDKESRRSLGRTCARLREVFLDPGLWTLLHFSSPAQLRRDNFILGASLRYLSISWHSSRVLQVCNVEDWLKSSFQKDICSKHQTLVSDFLRSVCKRCPNLLLLSLAGCGHVSDLDLASVLRSCPRLRCLRLENCVRVTDAALDAALDHGARLEELSVDFCRNVSGPGLRRVRERRPGLRLRAERSASMLPDRRPEDRRPEDSRPEDRRPEDRRPEDRRPEDRRPKDSRPEDRRPEDRRPEDSRPEDSRPAGRPLQKLLFS